MAEVSNAYATTKANSYVYKQMPFQANLTAYIDAFAIVALLAFLLIPLSFFMKIKTK